MRVKYIFSVANNSFILSFLLFHKIKIKNKIMSLIIILYTHLILKTRIVRWIFFDSSD